MTTAEITDSWGQPPTASSRRIGTGCSPMSCACSAANVLSCDQGAPGCSSLIDNGDMYASARPTGAASEVLTADDLTAGIGKLPVNTCGGNIADSFRQSHRFRRRSGPPDLRHLCTGVDSASTSLFVGAPMAPLVSSTLFGNQNAL
ncbi:hypothetical protein [Gordonia sp. (in: high G+C Gram-positive bacteria)]|uniref:hypothetical protein n=1 Tax=Gordonia sp. (in: high G+C Gram-positive bacteria) TaxID=84139 RepID=UPI003C75E009